jgi:hypothetical protein
MPVLHNTIRKYTAALLDLFNDLEVQYDTSAGSTITKKIPLNYSTKEKSRIIEGLTAEQLKSGNYNVLPRANLSLSTLVKSETRIKNKNLKINSVSSDTSFEYQYNSVPYEFTFELTIACRGMSEASMVIEQVAPKFNPTVNIDIWDGLNLHEPTRVPVKLLDISLESEEYEEFSSNIITLSIGLSIIGNLYPPIKNIQRIKDFKIYINENDGGQSVKKSILGWDVDDSGALTNEEITNVDATTYSPTLVEIVGSNILVGDNTLSVIYEDKDNKLSELTFDWDVIQGSASVVGDLDQAILSVTTSETVEVQVTVTDAFGNFASIARSFVV